MVLSGQVNRELVSLINEHGPLAVGALRRGRGAVHAVVARGAVVDGEEVDLGLVGDVVAVDPAAVHAQLDAGRIPVVSSIAPDGDVPGQSLNVNADSAAAALAVALGAAKLVDPHRCRGPLPRLAEPRLARLGHRRAGAHRAAAAPRVGHDPEDDGVPRGRRGRRREGRDHRRPACRTRSCSRSSRSPASARRWCPHERHGRPERVAGPLRPAHHALHRHAAREARRTARAPGCGTTTGHEYLDFLAGIAVNSLGHAHPVFVEAVADAGGDASRTSPTTSRPSPQLELAERLTRLAGAGDTAAPGSATPAPRPTRPRSSSRASTTRAARARACSRSSTAFHGRTMGSLALTGKPHMREAVRAAARRRRAHPRDDRGARGSHRRRRRGALRRADPGRGGRRRAARRASSRPRASSRTGTARCSSSTRSRPAPAAPASGSPSSTTGITPDAITRREGHRRRVPDRRRSSPSARASSLYSKGQHGSTFGGNPLATAVVERRARRDRARRPRRERRACAAGRSASASRASARRSSPARAAAGLLIGVAPRRARRRPPSPPRRMRAGLIVNAAQRLHHPPRPAAHHRRRRDRRVRRSLRRALDAVAAAHH